ncbi:MAG TPA: amidohydrolase family protein [Gemmatimonadales bacterium]|nr:amidohydrolase family protein [Gemmatimonadales bacterium]
MSTLLLALTSLLLPSAAPHQGPTPPAPGDSTVVAFDSVTVVPMDRERVLDSQTVIVRDGKIAEIGPSNSVQVPAGAIRVNGKGKYLMPGIAEMHAHVPSRDDPTLDAVMALYVLTGATTVRAMMGTPDQLEYRKEIASGLMLGPTLFAVGPPFNGDNTKNPQDAEAKVRQFHAAGFDVLKIFPGMNRETYDAILRTARELHMPISGHVPSSVGVRHAIESGQSIEHLDGYLEDIGRDRGRIQELVQLTTTAGIWNCPTMDVWKTILGLRDPDELLRDRPEVQYMPPQLVDQWTKRVREMGRKSPVRLALEGLGMSRSAADIAALRDTLLRALSDGGAKLLLGSDSPQAFSVPGFSLAHEMDAMVAAGLSNWTVLSAATRNPAEFFGRSAEFGTVEVGKRADLLLLDGNPLDDIRNVHRQAGVMVRGHWLAAEEINRRLAQIAAAWKRR